MSWHSHMFFQFPPSHYVCFPVSVISALFFPQLFSHHLQSHHDYKASFLSHPLAKVFSSLSSFHLLHPTNSDFIDLQLIAFSVSTHRLLSDTHKTWCSYKFTFSNSVQSSKMPWIYTFYEPSLSRFSHTSRGHSDSPFFSCPSGMHYLLPHTHTRMPSGENSRLPVTPAHGCIQK